MSDEKPPTWADEMLRVMHDTASEVRALKEQVRIQNGRVFALEQAKKSDSLRARVDTESKTNLEQDAAIASLVVKVDAIEGKVDATYKAVTGALSNPKVLAAGRIVFLLLAAYAAGKGIKVLP